MRASPKTFALVLAATTLALTACSKPADNAPNEVAASATDAAANSAASAATAESGVPDIGLVPGVAFKYDYAFMLPTKAISGVQQRHASACRQLGASRCRITGISYDQPDAETARGSMNLLLAPDAAHSFGSAAIAEVEKAEGKLDRASVDGEDAGSQITLSQENSAAIQAEVARLDARLKAKGLSNQERTDLSRQVEELRGELRSQVQARREKEQSLATTPVQFTYSSQSVIGTSGSFSKAAAASWDGFGTMLSVLVLVLGYALPWLLPVGVLLLILRYRKAKKLLNQNDTAPSAAVAAKPAAH